MHKSASTTYSPLFQAVQHLYKCESVNYLSSIVLDAKLVVIHSGLDVVRVRLRRQDMDLHAAVRVYL